MSIYQRAPDQYYQSERRELIKYIPMQGSRVLEIGCGEGAFALMLKKECGYKEAWGMEFDEQAASVADTRLDRVIRGDIDQTLDQLPDNYFDLICMNDVIEHLVWPEDIVKRLKEKLRHGGNFFCSVPNIRQYRILWNLIQHQDFEYTEQGTLDRTHLRFFTPRTILSMLNRAGYEVVLVDTCCGSTKSFKYKILNALTLWRGQDMQHSHIFVLAKPV